MANQKFNGIGEVIKAQEHVCSVQYKIQQRDTPTGHIEISGEVVEGESERRSVKILNILGSGELMNLHLDDGQ